MAADDRNLWDSLPEALRTNGAAAAAESLIGALRQRRDYRALFYALLLRKRLELGMVPLPTAPIDGLPEETQGRYEAGVRDAAREVGRLLLEANDIPGAWVYFRMIEDPGPVIEALERAAPAQDEDPQLLIQIAWHEGLHPRKGFDWVLDRYGVCNAISLVTDSGYALAADVRAHCVKRLVRAVYEQLRQALQTEIRRRQATDEPRVERLIAERDWLFEDDAYHVDVSHLGAVVQMSVCLAAGPELTLARELCAYGAKLSPRVRFPGEAPFEDLFRAHGLYLAALAGENVEEGLAYFRERTTTTDPALVGSRPAEVLVGLLARLGREREALETAAERLALVDRRGLTCPSIEELCARVGAYAPLAEVSRQRGDPVGFLAGLIAGVPPARHGRAR